MDGDQGARDLRLQLRDIGSFLISLSEGSNSAAGDEYVRSVSNNKFYRDARHEDDTPLLRRIAIGEYNRRRSRVEFFDAGLFSEAAWDILLDLFVATIDGKRVSVKSACLAASCPPTTALRWIAILEGKGFILRSEDPRDQRRSWLSLTEKGDSRMRSYLRSKRTLTHELALSGMG